jgi:transcription-repair coupling factor (superfamily II helicase)
MLWQETIERHEQRRNDIERPILEPHEIGLPPEELHARLGQSSVIELSPAKIEPQPGAARVMNFPSRAAPRLRLDPRATDPAAALGAFLETFTGRVLLAAESAGRRELLLQLLNARGIAVEQVAGWHEFLRATGRIALAVSPTAQALVLESPPLAVVTEELIFGARNRRARGGAPNAIGGDPQGAHRPAPRFACGAR